MPMGSQKSIIEHFLNLFRKERQGYVKKEKQSAGSRILSKEKDAVSEARFKQDLDKVITADKEEEEKEEEATLKKNSSPQPKTAEEPDIYDAEHDSRKENGFYNKEANQESETSPYPHIDQKFEHLSFIAIMFRPKNGNLGEALNEAAEYSSKAGVPVHISNNGKNYKIECVE